jgi:hypothetical protein
VDPITDLFQSMQIAGMLNLQQNAIAAREGQRLWHASNGEPAVAAGKHSEMRERQRCTRATGSHCALGIETRSRCRRRRRKTTLN